MINGYVDAYKAFGNMTYLERAEKAAHELLKDQMSDDFRLLRNHKDGKSSINAFLDDYALTIQSFLSLYEVTFDDSWINISRDLLDYAITHFYDDKSKMFFYTSAIDPPLVARKKELSDNVIPASNSVMAKNLYRLGELFYDQKYIEMSDQMLANIWDTAIGNQQPSFYSNWLQLQMDRVKSPYEIAIVGKEAREVGQELMSEFKANAFYMGSLNDSDLPLLKYKYVEDKTLIYVCQNKTCKFPVESPADAIELMK